MLTQNDRVRDQLIRGPVSQFWGVNQPGEEKILRLAARIQDLKDMGYKIEKFKSDGVSYYKLTDEPDESPLPLPPRVCRKQTPDFISELVGLHDQAYEQLSFV